MEEDEEAEESDSTTSEIKKFSYFKFLKELEKLLNLSNSCKNVVGKEDQWNVSQIDSILNNIDENMEQIYNEMSFEKKSIFPTSILNVVIRICAFDQSDCLISRPNFGSIFDKLIGLVWDVRREDDFNPACATDLFDSMMNNLSKDQLGEKCFQRIFSPEIVSTNSDSNTKKDEESSEENRKTFPMIISEYLDRASDYTGMMIISSAAQFQEKHSSIIKCFLDNVNICLNERKENLSSCQIYYMRVVLGNIWGLSDRLIVIPMFIDFGYIEKILRWIDTDLFKCHIDKLARPIFSIIHNLSRDEIVFQQFRKENAFNIIIQHKNMVDRINDAGLTQGFGNVLTDLSTSDQIQGEVKAFILNTSSNLYKLCKEASENDNFQAEGFHLSELFLLLHRAFSNSSLIEDFLENKSNENPTPIEYFLDLFLSIYGLFFDREANPLHKDAALYLLKILSEISSYPQYQKQFIENNRFYVLIESLANHSKLEYASLIWSSLQQHISSQQTQQQSSSNFIYLLYQSNDLHFTKLFLHDLQYKIHFPIWVDYEHLQSSNQSYQNATSDSFFIILLSNSFLQDQEKVEEMKLIFSKYQTNRLILIKIQSNLNLNRYGIKDLFKDKTILSFDNRMEYLAQQVYQQITPKKKSFFKCFSFARTTKKSNDENQSSNTISLLPTKDLISNIPQTKRISYSIVSSLNSHTGTTDPSTWV